ncbi:hypothetical protein [Streptomyces sp. NPDC002587]
MTEEAVAVAAAGRLVPAAVDAGGIAAPDSTAVDAMIIARRKRRSGLASW